MAATATTPDIWTNSTMTIRWTDAASTPINPPGTAERPLADAAARLAALAEEVHGDLHTLRHPETDWMPQRLGPDGAPMLDVLIAGAGQGGLALAGQLIRERVTNIQVIDKTPEGKEGVWNDFGRMPVIRSPKQYPGPDQGVASLTYEAWHRAKFGDADWEAVVLVPIPGWTDYLAWVRQTLALPVLNETELTRIEPAEDCLRVTLSTKTGEQRRYVRRLVLATGHDGTGKWDLPDVIAELPEGLRARASDPIDFARLRGKRVAVLGVGASAGDNAICALEAGVRELHMFCRRPSHRRQQVYRWCIFAGFLRHFNDLDDAWRWRFMHYILNIRMGLPPETWNRMNEFAAFSLHAGTEWRGVGARGPVVEIETNRGAFEVDFVIAGTGHDQDLHARPELRAFAAEIALWADRYQPPPELADARLARYPYIGPNFEFLEKVPGTAPFLSRIHDFTFGPTLSFGPSGCSISTLRLTVAMLVAGVTRGLFTEDVETHWQAVLDYPHMIP